MEYVAVAAASHKVIAKLIWQSDHFAPEVINPRYLVHDAAAEAPVAMELLHDPGRAVVERYGCARCHPIAGVDGGRRPGQAWALASQMNADYLARYLRNPQSLRPGTRMPAIGGTPKEIDAVVAALVAYIKSLTPPPEITPVVGSVSDGDQTVGGVSDGDLAKAGGSQLEGDAPAAEGRRRFRQLGCAACHAPEAPEEIDATLAPSLADVGSKWPENFIEQFLLDPVGWHPQGGMPDFNLKPIDAQRLAAYLSTFHHPDDTPPTPSAETRPSAPSAIPDPGLIARGKQLADQYGCAACHEIPSVEITAGPGPRLDKGTDLASGCLRADRVSDSVPHFTLRPADRVAVEEFLFRRPAAASPVAPQEIAERTIRHTLQCFQCHSRDGTGGGQLSRALARYLAEDKASDQISLVPPDISGVGARLQREWMLNTLVGDSPSARPWLKVRMPGFGLTEQQRARIVDRLAVADEIPNLKAPRPHQLPPALHAVAGQLLGGGGFSCVNCHYIGRTPSAGETSAPDLTMITDRVSRDWFHRWLSNPARIIPSTPMPAFNRPATKIAGEDLLVQKETVWQFLKHTPAAAIKKALAEGTTAVRVAGLRPHVVQGRIEGFAGVVRGIAIGFSNRNSLVFDFQRVAWRAAWKDGFLNQAGRHGAQHWWEPAGTATWISHDNGPAVLFREKATGRWIGPALWRNRFGFVDRVTLIGRAVRIDYRLRAPGERTGTHEPRAWVRVSELIEPNPAGADRRGTRRTIQIAGVPEGYDVIVQQSLGGADAKPIPVGGVSDGDRSVSKHPTLVVQSSNGRRVVMRLGGSKSTHWITPPESITYPVEQPFSDDLPMDPQKRFDPVVQPGAGRVAVLIANPDSGEPNVGEPLELTWQTAEYTAGQPIAAGPPKPWPPVHGKGPPEAPVLQDPNKPHYVSYPVEVQSLGQSRRLSVPPGFKVERLPLEEEFLVCGLSFYRGKLLVGGYDGELRLVDDTDDDGLPDSYRYFGGTLQQVTNLCVFDGDVYATSPGAVYRIRDLNGDEVADSYELLSSLWDCSAHQNDWFFGLTRDKEGNLYGGNSTPYVYRPGGKPPGYYLRGDVLKITPDGRTLKVGTGLRFQFGWAGNRQGRMYFNINQGHYNYTNGIHLVTEGAHYGFLEPDLSKVQWPVVRVPYPWCKSLNGMEFAESPVPFGPFQDQGFSADYNTNQVIRWTDYQIDDPRCPKSIPGRQGACYPFFSGTDAGPTEIIFGPDGAMYVGFMCDQGWYGGQARSGIYKISYVGPQTFAIRHARATKDGFRIELTDRADPASVTPDVCPKVHRWWHENKGTYASPEIAHEDVPVHDVTLSGDGRTLMLKTDPHVTPRLYRVELKGLRSTEGRDLADGLVYLTVHWVP